jgi:hypothetical protein
MDRKEYNRRYRETHRHPCIDCGRGDAVKEATERLCAAPCVFWFGYYDKTGGECKNRLLPITSKGEDCPYFEQKQEAKC